MNLQNRLMRLVYSREQNVIIASDVRGRVHKLDRNLSLLQSSPAVTYNYPINSLCLWGRYVLTRDRLGTIGKWDFATLMPLDFHDPSGSCDVADLAEDEEVSPSSSRAIACLNGRLYTCNGYNQIVVLDIETFQLLDVRQSPSPTFIDCMCVDHPQVHAMSDFDGNLFIGNLERNEFPVRVKIDTDVVHGVVYDRRHGRFWTTQDGGLGEDKCVRTGVTVIEVDGTGFKEFKLSHEDNEFIACDPEGDYVFAGGFNGKIGIFDNSTRDFCLEREIGPLEFQIAHAAISSRDEIYALLQTGNILRLNGRGEEVARTRFENRCAWILEPHPSDDSLVYVGTDQGVAQLRYGPGRFGTVEIEQLAVHSQDLGIVKDVKPLPDGSYVGVSRQGDVFKADREGRPQWKRKVQGVPRAIALSPDYTRCLVSTDAGIVWEFESDSGEERDQLSVGSPSYACVYHLDGRRVLAVDGGQQILVYEADSHRLLGSVHGFNWRLKRLRREPTGEILVAGPDGMFELDLINYVKGRYFGEHMISTKENGVLCQGHVHVGGYGYQVATYRYADGKLLNLEEDLPDYTKAFAARVPEDGIPILLVGGRGGFIMAYRVYRGAPHKVREFYLH